MYLTFMYLHCHKTGEGEQHATITYRQIGSFPLEQAFTIGAPSPPAPLPSASAFLGALKDKAISLLVLTGPVERARISAKQAGC